jgi:hypothetical protein
VLYADIEAAFDNLAHSAVLERMRARIKGKRVLALVKAFLKAGILTETGNREDTFTGHAIARMYDRRHRGLAAKAGRRMVRLRQLRRLRDAARQWQERHPDAGGIPGCPVAMARMVAELTGNGRPRVQLSAPGARR